MTSHTDDDFEFALDADLGWRKIELSAMKKILDDAYRQGADRPASRALSRAMVAMCYAHWEGFAKNSLERYARLVSKRKPKLSESGEGLVIEHVSRLMKRIGSGDAEARQRLLDAVRGKSDDRLNLEKSVLADTKSNLRYQTLSGLFEIGCIPISSFELKANLIDVSLCDRRNSVAHGRAYFPTCAESLELCDSVLGLLSEMRDLLVEQVRRRLYLVGDGPA